MKKLFFTIAFFSFIIWFTGCNEDSLISSETDDLATFNKAGTNLMYPNTFDANGVLCVLGENDLKGTLGTPMEIWMGVGNKKAGTLVGRITFDGADVIIDLKDADNDGMPDMYPYVVTLVHVDFEETFAELPQTKKGNPIPGQFETHKEADPYATSLVIENAINVGLDKFGAIHMEVVKYGGVKGFNFYLPDNEVTMTVAASSNSYNKIHIENGGFISSYNSGLGEGWYESWCIAADLGISYSEFSAYLYSSYETIPVEVLTQAKINADNLDNANWLLNHYSVGDPVFDADNESLGNLTVMDIQNALWILINNKGSYNPKVSIIVAEALANGEGFKPDCDQKIIFLAVPMDPNMIVNAQILIGQPLIAEIPVPCEDEGGTAWGDGYYGATFPGKQWGTWFQYNENCIPN